MPRGLLGLANNPALVEKTGVKRDINRAVIDPNLYATQLADPHSKYSLIRHALSRISLVRASHPAFHPQGAQKILDLSPSLFAVLRTSRRGDRHVLSLINVTDQSVLTALAPSDLGVDCEVWQDLVGGGAVESTDGHLHIDLAPYAVVWLSPQEH